MSGDNTMLQIKSKSSSRFHPIVSRTSRSTDSPVSVIPSLSTQSNDPNQDLIKSMNESTLIGSNESEITQLAQTLFDRHITAFNASEQLLNAFKHYAGLDDTFLSKPSFQAKTVQGNLSVQLQHFIMKHTSFK